MRPTIRWDLIKQDWPNIRWVLLDTAKMIGQTLALIVGFWLAVLLIIAIF